MRQLCAVGLIAVFAGVVQAQPVFRQSSRENLAGSTGDYVATVIVADVGRPGGGAPDGNLDVLTLNRNQQVPVFFGRGDGRFAVGHTTTVGVVPAAFALGDFTGDGILDLVVANESQGTVAFHRGAATGPPWAASGPSIAAGAVPVALLAADVNRDGKLDVVAVDEGLSGQGAIVVLLGNGDGTFLSGGAFPTGSFSAAGAVGNFDNDLFPDVAVANAGANSVTIMRNDGAGGFSVAQTKTVGAGPTSIAAGLIDGDDRLDLAVANADGDSVSVLLGRGGAQFDSATTFSAGSEGSAPASLALADVNGDGRLDVLTANRVTSDVSVLLGNGTGSLGRPRAFVSDEQPEAVAAGDLNGDGLDDAVAVNSAGPPPTMAVLLALPDGSGALTGVEDVLVLPNPMALAGVDADDSGIADVVAGPSVAGAVAAQLALAEPTGGFAAPLDLPGAGGAVAAVQGDFNGDGSGDLAVANKLTDSVSVFLRVGIAQFGALVSTAVGSGVAGVSAGDWNRDGRSDLAVIRQIPSSAGEVDILLANGDGTFMAAAPLVAGPSPTGIDRGDFNNDGRLDLVASNQGSGTLSVWIGAGNGTFGSPSAVVVTGGPRAVVVGDFDRDGFDDLATLVQTPSSQLGVFFGDGTGSFGVGPARALPSGGVGAALAARDLTGDLVADLTVADQVNNAAVVFVAPGDRTTFRDIQGYPVSRGPMSAALGDFDGDGRYDGAVANQLAASASVLTNIRATPALRGDGNTDGRVTAADVVAVFRELPENPTGRVEAIDRGSFKPGAGIDANGDGLVTAQDSAGTIAWAFRTL